MKDHAWTDILPSPRTIYIRISPQLPYRLAAMKAHYWLLETHLSKQQPADPTSRRCCSGGEQMPDKYLVERHLPPHKSIDSTPFPAFSRQPTTP